MSGDAKAAWLRRRESSADLNLARLAERLHEGEPGLRQVGALFALHAFWTTQPANARHFHLQVDPGP